MRILFDKLWLCQRRNSHIHDAGLKLAKSDMFDRPRHVFQVKYDRVRSDGVTTHVLNISSSASSPSSFPSCRSTCTAVVTLDGSISLFRSGTTSKSVGAMDSGFYRSLQKKTDYRRARCTFFRKFLRYQCLSNCISQAKKFMEMARCYQELS